MEEIKSYCSLMTANDWRERQNGIMRMHEMITRNPAVVGTNLVKVSNSMAFTVYGSLNWIILFFGRTE